MDKNQWFNVAPGEADNTAKITIDGEIGYDWWDGSGMSSNAFMNAVKALGEVETIEIDMNSPGGAVADGLTIANYLRNHAARVVINVLGQASSIASVIATAADEVHMGLGSFMFVHKASSLIWGNSDQVQALANDLATIDEGILEVYVSRVGEERREEMVDLIAGTDGNGTLISAAYAVELGLADSMTEARAAASVADFVTSMRNATDKIGELESGDSDDEDLDSGSDSDDAGTDIPIAAIAACLGVEQSEVQQDIDALFAQIRAGADISAESLQETHPSIFQAIQASGASKARDTAIAAERERVMTILKAAAVANHFGCVEKLISEAWEADKASDFIIAAAAGQDPNIHTSHSPEGGQKSVVDPTAIYARRKAKATS